MMTRRQSLAIGLGTSLGLLAGRAGAQPTSGRSRTLVAFFTRSGNTRLIAGKVRRDLGADLFEITPAEPYPEDYEDTVAQAEREKRAAYEPPLKGSVGEIGAYSTVYLGFPIWGSTAPTVIKSFLSKHDLAGKELVPLITHGGYGAGDSLAVLRRMAPNSTTWQAVHYQDGSGTGNSQGADQLAESQQCAASETNCDGAAHRPAGKKPKWAAADLDSRGNTPRMADTSRQAHGSGSSLLICGLTRSSSRQARPDLQRPPRTTSLDELNASGPSTAHFRFLSALLEFPCIEPAEGRQAQVDASVRGQVFGQAGLGMTVQSRKARPRPPCAYRG